MIAWLVAALAGLVAALAGMFGVAAYLWERTRRIEAAARAEKAEAERAEALGAAADQQRREGQGSDVLRDELAGAGAQTAAILAGHPDAVGGYVDGVLERAAADPRAHASVPEDVAADIATRRITRPRP